MRESGTTKVVNHRWGLASIVSQNEASVERAGLLRQHRGTTRQQATEPVGRAPWRRTTIEPFGSDDPKASDNVAWYQPG